MTATRIRRTVIAGSCLLLWLGGIWVTWTWFDLGRSAAEPIGSLPLANLSAPVVVHADSFGIPHLFASTEEDALAALGYQHASDRLWQMDLFRRIASGRLAEVFGEPGLETDRFVRTLGTWRAAERAAAGLAPDERARIASYAAGVNAFLARDPVLPPEFRILEVEPEPWDLTATLAVGMVMNLDLAVWRSDLSRYWASRHLDSARFAVLLTGYPDWGPTILDGTREPPAQSGSLPARQAPSVGHAGGAPEDGLRDDSWSPFEVLATMSARSGSNAWVVAGERTANGHPILANDMHLALRAPALWYLAALHGEADGFHVAGFTLPGVPGVVVGHNLDVAWGFTNGMVDDVDFVVETLSPDGRQYRDRVDGADSWKELEIRTDTIAVRGRDTPYLHTIRSTRRGPLLSDALPGLEADLSVLWVAARASASSTGLHGLNRARSPRELDEAIQTFARPHQNVVFAGRDGTIGYRLGGRIPLRQGWDGALPASADEVGEGWNGFWPAAEHPAALQPARGYVATANNLQARGLGRAVSSDYAPPFRALRLTQALEVRRDWTPASTYGLQHDTRSLLADRVIGRAIAAARRAGLTEQADLLAAWDRDVRVESREAPLFYSWFYRLRALIAADEWRDAPQWELFPMEAMLQTLDEGDGSPWIDDLSTSRVESLAELEEQAIRDAIRVTGGASWGELHQERHAHPLGSVAWLDRLFGLHVGPYPSGGGPNTLRPNDYRIWTTLDDASWTPPWTSEYGPSERFVAELAPRGIRGRFLLPTGQSGNPLSSHYRDLNARWRAGDLVDVPLDPDSARARSVRSLVLVPDG